MNSFKSSGCEILKININGETTEVVIGKTKSMQKLCRDAKLAAKYSLPVLITGETGSGKEWLASMIHCCGRNFSEPFLDINCGAITSTLMESLFFGHEKGAFTGASQGQIGYFSQVGCGTILLDEIGELPMDLQPKLLRVLETGFFRPVGASKNVKFKGRVVAATHRDLEQMVKDGSFREDLLHRLNVLTLTIPSLAERKNDIPFLVNFFLSKRREKIRLTDCAVNLLKEQEWKGNVRELRNTIDKICVFSSEEEVNAMSLRSFIPYSGCYVEKQLRRIVSEILELNISNKMLTIESLLITQALERYEGNKTRAADELGMHRKALERRVKSMITSVGALHEELKRIEELQIQSDHIKVIELTNRCYTKSMNLSCSREVLEMRYELLKLRCLSEREQYGWNSSYIIKTYNEIVKLSRALNDSARIAFHLFGLWSVQLVNNKLEDALSIALQLDSIAEQTGCKIVQCKATIALANTQFWMGAFDDSEKNLIRFRGVYDSSIDMISESGVDLQSLYLFLSGLTNCMLGHFNTASSIVSQLNEYVENNTHFFSQVIGYQALTMIEFLFSHHNNSNKHALKLVELTQKMDYRLYYGLGLVFHGAYIIQRNSQKGESIMNQGEIECRKSGKVFIPFYCLIRAKYLLERKDISSALKQIEKGLTFAVSGPNYAFYSELLFLRSVCMVELGADDYENDLREAYRLVKSQNSKFMQLRILYFSLKRKLKITYLFFDEETFYDETVALLGNFSEDDHHPILDYVRFRVGWGFQVDL